MVFLNPSPSAQQRGFALLMVLWVVAILSAVSLTLIASSRAEARHASDEWEHVVRQRLAHSGQEIERYLRTRSLGSTAENLSGTFVEARMPGFQYSIRLPEGSVDLFLESDAGKIGLIADDVQLLQNFLTQWQGQAAASMLSIDAIKEWSKRNNSIGVASLPAIPGFSFADFQPKLVQGEPSWTVRESIDEFLNPTALGAQVNPNFAPRLVLLALPGLTPDQAETIVRVRKQGVFFKGVDDFRAQLGMPADHPALRYLRFDRGLTPTVLTILKDASGRQFAERRVYELMPSFNPSTGGYDSATRLQRVQVDHLPPFLKE